MTQLGHFIDGRMVSDDGRSQEVFNPATGYVSKTVPLASKETVETAITAAEAAYPAWRDTPVAKRARVMFKFKQLLEENSEKLAALIGEEH